MLTDAAGRQEELCWLALHLVPGLGPRNALKLVKSFGSPERVFQASLSELRSLGLRLATAESIHAGITFDDAADELRKAGAAGVAIVPVHDARYPQRLKEIFDPPILLYARGDLELLNEPSVAVVGTRRPSAYGRAVAQKLTRELVAAGLTHVSGMARGIDAAAHQGALEAGGRTVAVLGCGADVVYPKDNQKLAEAVIAHGLIVSEFPMGSTAFPQNFPIRNRIISGMSLGVVVVEGAQYSGSLITARLGLDQGREVMAVPGNITSKQSWGPNLLIKDGAKLIQEAADIIEELPLPVRRGLRPAAPARQPGTGDPAAGATSEARQASLFTSSVSEAGRAVLAALRVDEAIQVDALIRSCGGLTPAEVLAALSELELYGLIQQMPGKAFVRVWTS